MLEIGGVELLPPITMFLAFALSGLALNLVPGADMAYVIASGARSGASAGVAASVEVAAGALCHTLLTVIGISALIASSPMLFDALKWLGGAYLVYLAVKLVRERGSVSAAQIPTERSNAAIVRGGMLVNLLNPKVALFFVAFLPQFVDPAAQSRALQMLALGLWFNLVGTLVNCVIGIAAAGAGVRLRKMPWLPAVARWVAAFTFVGLALRLILSDRTAELASRA